MKKYLSLALAVAMLLSTAALASCSGDEATSTNKKNSSNPPANSSSNVGGPTSGKPDESENNPPPSEGLIEDDPNLVALEALYVPYANVLVENKDEFKADAKNTNLMEGGYFNAFNFEMSIFNNFEYDPEDPDNTDGLGSEAAPNMFDQNTDTKWCAGAAESEYNNAIVWSMTQACKVTGYSFTSGNDNVTYDTRNPITWRLYGWSGEGDPSVRMDAEADEDGSTYLDLYKVPDGWTLISAVDAKVSEDDYLNSLMPDLNFEETCFKVEDAKVGTYTHFMLLIDTNENNCIQISELTLYGTVSE